MSNRNYNVTKSQSKSPKLTNYIKIKQNEKELMKQLLLKHLQQKNENEEVLDFKQQIENRQTSINIRSLRYKKCQSNQQYNFPLNNNETDSESSIQSLRNVKSYNLYDQNIGEEQEEEEQELQDATQPEFVRQVNQRLLRLQQEQKNENIGEKIKTEGDEPYFPIKQKQFNYANCIVKDPKTNLSDTSLLFRKNNKNDKNDRRLEFSQGIRDTSKPIYGNGFRNNRTPYKQNQNNSSSKGGSNQNSAQKNDIQQSVIQRLMKITNVPQQQKTLKRDQVQQVNNHYINVSTNFNNNTNNYVIQETNHMRIKTEPNQDEDNMQIVRNIKKRDISQMKPRIQPQIYDIKMLNYTLDQKTIDQVQRVVRQAKSQNKNYKV